ncbi:unnamed protein product [Microthlaspi erraticum]|uniref:DUF4283 domain-containing protein n=1 Tax=Microthlaspi erraticum TaxID=1685480 RepID=A0A6D2KJZ8_9BRAS|nr:unnamed protein product [Microthlaspi erraticum]
MLRFTAGDSRVDGARVQDAHMEDAGEKGRPPGEPPDAPDSWAQKVGGGSLGGRLVPEEVVDAAFIEARLCLEFPDGEEGEPVVTIGEEVLTAMNGLWKNCMIVRVLGRSVSIAVMSRKLRELWKPKGVMYVMDLPRQFFMVRFEREEEFLAALTGGPWKAFGSYLMSQAWSPDFDPLKSDTETTPVWVRLSNIPVNFYHQKILMGIAKGLGKPVKVDDTTLNFERARFARVCVEVNLKKPLKGTIVINGERYFVSYEGLSNICSWCGLYGHLVHSCPKKPHETVPVAVTQTSPMSARDKEGAPAVEGFTEVRMGRKQPAEVAKLARAGIDGSAPNKASGEPNIALSNSFGSLKENMENLGVDDSGREKERDRGKEIRGIRGSKEDTRLVGKENIAPNANVNREQSWEHGNGIVFGSGSGKGLKQNRSVSNGKRIGQGKAGVVGRPKQPKVNRPARGLIFRPRTDDIELPVNGKRPRVEQSDVGRSGGVAINERVETQANSVEGQHHRDVPMDVQPSQVETEAGSDLAMHGAAVEKPSEEIGA